MIYRYRERGKEFQFKWESDKQTNILRVLRERDEIVGERKGREREREGEGERERECVWVCEI